MEQITDPVFPARLELHIDHIGINADSCGDAKATAAHLASLFGLVARAGQKSEWAGELFEIVGERQRGTHGHICLAVRSVEEFLRFAAQLGTAADMSTAKYNDRGELRNVYLAGELAGFAFHIKRSE